LNPYDRNAADCLDGDVESELVEEILMLVERGLLTIEPDGRVVLTELGEKALARSQRFKEAA
jgi:Mn-dependent DtxR family transcriptional regulator